MAKTIYNLLRGAGSVVDLWPKPRRSGVGREILAKSDAEALRGDWERVGEDLKGAMDRTRVDGRVE